MMNGGDWFWGALMMLLFLGGLAAAIVFAVRASGSASRPRADETKDAQGVLETRLANGEISREEFEERRKVLGSGVR